MCGVYTQLDNAQTKMNTTSGRQNKDLRLSFLCKETQEVFNSLAHTTTQLLCGLDETTRCFTCNESFKCCTTTKQVSAAKVFIFIVLVDYLKIDSDVLHFCCLKCHNKLNNVFEVLELYPTLSLHTVKKLMYYNVLKKFHFNFCESKNVLYKKYVVVDTLDDVLCQVLNEKQDNHEILKINLMCNNIVVAQDTIDTMRLDFNERYNFDCMLALNKKLINVVNTHCKLSKYTIEMYYKEYDTYHPFKVFYNTNNNNECEYCATKLCHATGHPIFYCSVCGQTDPNYYTRNHTMMLPFWRDKFDYNKIYWKTMKKKGALRATLMLYSVDTRRIL